MYARQVHISATVLSLTSQSRRPSRVSLSGFRASKRCWPCANSSSTMLTNAGWPFHHCLSDEALKCVVVVFTCHIQVIKKKERGGGPVSLNYCCYIGWCSACVVCIMCVQWCICIYHVAFKSRKNLKTNIFRLLAKENHRKTHAAFFSTPYQWLMPPKKKP